MAEEFLLAIETTCDETAAAIISNEGRVLSEAVASQEELHQEFDGVVPEIAARAHLDRIVPILRTVVDRSGLQPSQLTAIAVATEPGLPGSLLVGLCAAKALSIAWQKPLIAINHIHAHVYACQVGRSLSIFPCVGFVVSGGHTHLYHCRSALDWHFLGGTIDDAAGEAFDKVAVMLGLPFPGGPQLAKLADHGNPRAIEFPRPLMHDHATIGFSFSGLKTAVRYHLVGTGKQDFHALAISDQQRADVAASFQQAVVDCLVAKAMLAVKRTGLTRLCVGGGVAANRVFRNQLEAACRKHSVELIIAPANLCTDNAVMGALAWESFLAGKLSQLDLDARAGLVRNPPNSSS